MARLTSIPGGLHPGLSIRIRGHAFPTEDRFNINLQSGPNSQNDPFHISLRLTQGYFARNSRTLGGWEQEVSDIPLPIHKGQPFDILIKAEPDRYIVDVNGNFFRDFIHTIPFSVVDHVHIIGDVHIDGVTYEACRPGFVHHRVHHSNF